MASRSVSTGRLAVAARSPMESARLASNSRHSWAVLGCRYACATGDFAGGSLAIRLWLTRGQRGSTLPPDTCHAGCGSVEGELQPSAIHAWIAEVGARKRIAEVVDKRPVGQILHVSLQGDDHALPAQQVHPSRPAKNVPGPHALGKEIHQAGARQSAEAHQLVFRYLNRHTAFVAPAERRPQSATMRRIDHGEGPHIALVVIGGETSARANINQIRGEEKAAVE